MTKAPCWTVPVDLETVDGGGQNVGSGAWWRNHVQHWRRALCPAFWALAVVCATGFADGQPVAAQAAQTGAARGASGLPLPRFVSLKAQPVNLRRGPGTDFPIAWVMTFAGTPLEVTREYGEWREVRDVDGTTGWILGSLLSGRRTAVVQPWDRPKNAGETSSAPLIDLRVTASERSGISAKLEPGAIVAVRSCDTRWCAVTVSGFNGFVEQRRLWGVYPDEQFR